MLLLSVFATANGDDFAASVGDVATFVVVSGDASVAISTAFVAFNIFFTRTYTCTRTIRTIRIY